MANRKQASFDQEFTKIQWLKDKLIKWMGCTEPLDPSNPSENCKPGDVIAISEWNGIIRQLALAADINYTKAHYKTKRLLFELSLMVSRDANDGIATRRRESVGKNVRIVNDVRENDVLGVKGENFDKVMGKFTVEKGWQESKDTTSAKFENEQKRVTSILWAMKDSTILTLWRDKVTIFWNPLDPQFARVPQGGKTFIFDEPSGTKWSRTRNVYQLDEKGVVIGGVQVQESTNNVNPIQLSDPFKITFFPFKIESK